MAADDVFHHVGELTGLTAYDAAGEKIGSVEQAYLDNETGRAEWVTVKTGMFGMKESFVPLAGATRDANGLHVPHAKELVKDAPRMDADEHLDVAQEQELYDHYGLTRPSGRSGAPGMSPAPGTAAKGTTGGRDSMSNGARGQAGTTGPADTSKIATGGATGAVRRRWCARRNGSGWAPRSTSPAGHGSGRSW